MDDRLILLKEDIPLLKTIVSVCLCVCASLCTPGKNMKSPESVIMAVGKPPYECWELNFDP